MALSANTVWEVRTTGNDANGGGFVTGASGTDYSQQDSPQYALTGIATVGTGATFLTSTAAAVMVGNLCQIVSGTNFTVGFYQILSVSVGVSVTVDRNCCTGVGAIGVINIGGGMASLGGVGAVGTTLVSGNSIYIKAGAYNITSASANVSGGCFSTTSTRVWIYGYSTNRTPTNTDTPPTLTASGISTFVMITINAGGLIYNLSLNGSSYTSSKGCQGNGTLCLLCTFSNFTNGASSTQCCNCKATGCSTVTAFSGCCIYCEASANTFTPFSSSTYVVVSCLSHDNTGSSTDGFNYTVAMGCVAYNNGRDGFGVQGLSQTTVNLNCISESNVRYGYTTGVGGEFINCAQYGNGSTNPALTGASYNFQNITTGSVFVAPASGNFALNNISGRGAALRAAGYPSTFLSGTTANALDIGAVQHADPTITVPLASSIYSGQTVTSATGGTTTTLVTGTLHASNISMAAGANENVTTANLLSGHIVDDVTGEASGGGGGGSTGFVG